MKIFSCFWKLPKPGNGQGTEEFKCPSWPERIEITVHLNKLPRLGSFPVGFCNLLHKLSGIERNNMEETKGFSGEEHDKALKNSECQLTKERHDAENNGEVNNKVVQQPEEKCAPSPQEEEAVIKKKYGGILPKKPPLISKDHERAFFDSADWALGKQGAPLGQKPKGPIEALRPKLQPTPHQPLPARRPAYASPEGEDGEIG